MPSSEIIAAKYEAVNIQVHTLNLDLNLQAEKNGLAPGFDYAAFKKFRADWASEYTKGIESFYWSDDDYEIALSYESKCNAFREAARKAGALPGTKPPGVKPSEPKPEPKPPEPKPPEGNSGLGMGIVLLLGIGAIILLGGRK